MKTFAAAAIAASASASTSNHWAVIMAGSNTWANYRHQADSHHAVKIMLANGIPRDQIIHLAYDDLAFDRQNPFPGQLFNASTQTGTAGHNVYDQSEIDYRRSDVTKENFFKVLLGDTSASGPVLGSDADSKVFVYFVDHGGSGLICTPSESSADWIYADELQSTIQQMKDTNMFKELVFYLEACESGSMFPPKTLPDGVYAMTAASAYESSYAAYCDGYVNGSALHTCLGDVFSGNWMQDTEGNDPSIETLQAQHDYVKLATSGYSHVQEKGDFSFMTEPIGDFQGTCESDEASYTERMLHRINHIYKKATNSAGEGSKNTVNSRDHDLHYLYNLVMSGDKSAVSLMHAELEHRQFVDKLFGSFFDEVSNGYESPQDFDCLRMMLGGVEEMCGPWSAYSLQYVRKIANACDTKTKEEMSDLYVKVGEYCNAL